MESTQDKSKEQVESQPMTQEEKKKDGEVRAAAALKSLLSKPNAKENLYAVLKALTAMKLQKNDPHPNLVVCANEAKELRITDLQPAESFLF
jgi:protein-tyrosine phosphatase